MPLTDYIFDQSNIQSAVSSAEELIQNITIYTLNNITETLNAINSTSTEINQILYKFNTEIIPITMGTLKDMQMVSKKMVISMDAVNRLLNVLTLTLFVFMLFLLMIGGGYLYKIQSTKSMKQKSS